LAHETFLPWTGGAIEKNYLSGTIYESLTLRDRDGNMLPCLAKDWKMSADGKDWTVNIQKGITFHDAAGNTYGELTSADVKYTFEKLMGATSVSHIKGSLTDTTNGIASIETSGNYTVIFHMKGPNVGFMKVCSGPDMMGVVCKAYVEEYGDGVASTKPVGTGPYVLDSHVIGAYIQMRAIDDWSTHWRMSAISDPTKYFEYLKFMVVPDQNARVLGLLSGDFDVVEIGAEVVDQIEGQPGVTTLPDIVALLATDIIRLGGLNKLDTATSPTRYDPTNPWADPTVIGSKTAGQLVRQAMNLAIDKTALINSVYEGVGTPAATSMSIPEWVTTQTPYGYDKAQAETLLDQAGYPRSAPGKVDRFSMTLIADERYSAAAMSVVVADYWKAVGIDVKIENWIWTALRAAWQKSPETPGNIVHGYAWTHRTPPSSLDPGLAINMAFNPSNVIADYTDENTEAKRTAFFTELDLTKRDTKLKDLGAYVHEAATQIFLVSVYGPMGFSTELDEPRDSFDLKENVEYTHRK
jgi:peptide/nickel transport system substrate-binding protein